MNGARGGDGTEPSAAVNAAVDASRRWLDVAQALHEDASATPEERAERTRLFELPSGCPPYEAAWIRRDKGAILADVAGFYRAFGFDAAPDTGIRHDHLGAMAEFIALVCVMEARARAAGNAEQADIAHEACVDFLRDHLVDWVPSFLERLQESTMSRPLLHAAACIERAWESAQAMGLPALDLLDATSAPDPVPGTPYECGLATEEPSFVELTASAAPPP